MGLRLCEISRVMGKMLMEEDGEAVCGVLRHICNDVLRKKGKLKRQGLNLLIYLIGQ